MKLIKLQSFISNFAQDMADAMSADPEIKAARQEGLEKVKAVKAAAAAKARSDRKSRKELKAAHKEERKVVALKQKAEFALIRAMHEINSHASKAALTAAKVKMREQLRDIRKEQAEKSTKAEAYTAAESGGITDSIHTTMA